MYTIVKIPFDKCIVEKGRRGAALGPDEIEKDLKSHAKDMQKLKFVEVKENDDFEKLHKETENIAQNEYKKGNFVIGLGGDHSISYGLMKAFSKRFKNSGLICFDAHLDCEDDFLPPTHEDLLKAAVK
ncbi:MAG: arginase family protein, partial [DPANN group archaeon]|nr:arginase family protein [DPANN group archaeon]